MQQALKPTSTTSTRFIKMAIKLTDKIHTVSEDVDTTNRGSAQANSGRAAYTLQEVSDLIGGGGVTVANQVEGRLVYCSATTDELKTSPNIVFDFSTNRLSLPATEFTSARIFSSVSNNPGNYGRGSTLYMDISTVSVTSGRCYAIQGTTLTESNATSESNISTGWLGIATNTSSVTGMLVEGCVYLANTVGGNNGDPVYLDITAGEITTTPVSVIGNVSRRVGYKISGNQIYFNPSQDWTVIS